jgi:hypothetical protein
MSGFLLLGETFTNRRAGSSTFSASIIMTMLKDVGDSIAIVAFKYGGRV